MPHLAKPHANDRQTAELELVHQVLDGLSVRLALLDARGIVGFTNRAWRDSMGDTAEGGFVLGGDFLTACMLRSASGQDEFTAVAGAIKAILRDPIGSSSSGSRAAGAEGPDASATEILAEGNTSPGWKVEAINSRSWARVLVTMGPGVETHRVASICDQERELLRVIASNRPLSEVLEAFVTGHERLFPGTRCSVSLLDAAGTRFMPTVGPSLPPEYLRLIDGLEIGPAAGSCGTAAFTGQTVIVTDITTDPLWAIGREVPARFGLRACWSVPIVSLDGRRVLGTFSMYFTTPRAPATPEREAIESLAKLASLVIERAMTADAARKADANLRAALDAGKIGTWLFDPVTGRITWHPSALALFGLTEAAVGDGGLSPFLNLVHPDDLPALSEAISRSRLTGADYDVHYRLRRADTGEERWIGARGVAVRDDRGVVTGFAGACVDVTGSVLAAKRHQKVAERLELVKRACPLGTWELDAASNTIECDDRMLQMYGLDPTRSGVSVDELRSRLKPEDAVRLENELSAALNSGNDEIHTEVCIVMADGRQRTVETHATLIRDADGRVARIVGVDIDATETLEGRRELERTNEQLRLLVEGTDLVFWEYDPARESFTYVSPKAAKFGFPMEEWYRAGFWVERLHPDDRDRAVTFCAAQVMRGLDHRFQYRMVAADGREVWIDDLVTVSRDALGRRVLRGVFIDITDRKKAELALAESEARWNYAIDSAGFGIWDWNIETGGVFYSQGWKAMLGYSTDEVGNQLSEWERLTHPEDKLRVTANLQRHFAGETDTQEVEFRMLAKDGSYKWIRSIGRVTERGPEGRPKRMLGAHQDVTARRAAVEQLSRTAELLTRTGEIARIGGWDLDLITGELYWSDVVRRIHEVPPDFHPTVDTAIEFYDVAARPVVRRAVEHGIRSGEPWSLELPLITATGRRIWVLAQGSAEIRDGRPVRLLGTFQDITDRKLAEDERHKLETQIQRVQRWESIGMLAGGVAHDFNNLLTGMLGYAQLASLGLPPDSTVKPYLEQIVLGAKRAGELCQQLLAYAGKGKLVEVPIDASAVVREMVNLLHPAISYRANLVIEAPEGLQAFVGDSSQFRQVVMNLITNASDALGDSPGVIRIRTGLKSLDAAFIRNSTVVQDCEPGRFVFIEVVDSGQGMSPEIIARIFDPFFTTKFTGRGLGLAAVLGIVKGHGGTITVQSRLGQGTTFTAYFPAREASPAALPDPGPAARDHGPPPRVLVIEDEAPVRALIASTLERAGCTFTLSEDGDQGVAAFKRFPLAFDVVLLDLTMPRRDGIETLELLRQVRPDVRVVIMSGYSETDVTSRLGELSAGRSLSGFLHKPFSVQELLQAVGVRWPG